MQKDAFHSYKKQGGRHASVSLRHARQDYFPAITLPNSIPEEKHQIRYSA